MYIKIVKINKIKLLKMNKFKFCLIFLLFTSISIKSKLEGEGPEPHDPQIFDKKFLIEVVNSNLESTPIKLTPGLYEKIYVKITKLSNAPFHFHDLDLEIDDEDFRTEKKIRIDPLKGNYFVAYIGIKCGSQFEGEKTLNFKNTEKAFFCDFKPFNVTVTQEKTYVDFEQNVQELSVKGYGFLKFNLENIYPMEPTTFNFNFDNSKEVVEVQGALDIKKRENDEKITKSYLKYKAKKYVEDDNVIVVNITSQSMCILPKKDSFSFTINNLTIPEFKQELKKDIVKSIKVVEAKEENAIEIDMTIPLGNTMISCEARHGTGKEFDDRELFSDIKEEEYIDNEDEDFRKDRKYNVDDYISQNNTEYKLVFTNLYRLGVYRVKCKLNGAYDGSSKINIKIGHLEDADFKTVLRPNSFYKNLPRCIDFTFDKNDNIVNFTQSAIQYFYTQEKPKCVQIKERDLNNVLGYDENVKSLCTGINPLCMFNIKEDLDKITNDFTEELNTIEKINNTLGIEINNAFSLETVKDDESPDKNLINVTYIKESKDTKGVDITFSITNNNKHPIVCAYNKELEKNGKARWLNPLDLYGELNIANGQTATLNFSLKKVDNGYSIYSLVMDCGNLPGYIYHYYTTGPFIASSVYVSKENPKDYEKKDKANCENNMHLPECIARKNKEDMKKVKKAIDEFESDIPSFVDDVLDDISNFAHLHIPEQKEILKDELKKLKQTQKLSKEKLQQAYKILKQMVKKECTNSENYEECRKDKKTIFEDLFKEIKDYFSCNNILDNIKNFDDSSSFTENVKSILALISSTTDNSDSLNKDNSQFLYNLSYCVLDKFDEIWDYTNKEIKDLTPEESLNVKKDIIQLMVKSISNLVEIIKYDEADGFLEDQMKVLSTKILISETAKKLRKKIHHAAKLLWKLGNGNYVLDNLVINITKLDENEKDEKQEFNFTEYGIQLRIKKKKLLKKFKADLMQIIIYRKYPQISINNTESENKFISIKFFKDNNEVEVDDIDDDDRPEIVFEKTKFKKCVYYNEKDEDLTKDGLENLSDDKYTICKVKHFTDFSISNLDVNNGSSNTWKIILIIIFIILLAVAGFFVFMKTRNPVKNVDVENIGKNFDRSLNV